MEDTRITEIMEWATNRATADKIRITELEAALKSAFEEHAQELKKAVDSTVCFDLKVEIRQLKQEIKDITKNFNPETDYIVTKQQYDSVIAENKRLKQRPNHDDELKTANARMTELLKQLDDLNQCDLQLKTNLRTARSDASSLSNANETLLRQLKDLKGDRAKVGELELALKHNEKTLKVSVETCTKLLVDKKDLKALCKRNDAATTVDKQRIAQLENDVHQTQQAHKRHVGLFKERTEEVNKLKLDLNAILHIVGVKEELDGTSDKILDWGGTAIAKVRHLKEQLDGYKSDMKNIEELRNELHWYSLGFTKIQMTIGITHRGLDTHAHITKVVDGVKELKKKLETSTDRVADRNETNSALGVVMAKIRKILNVSNYSESNQHLIDKTVEAVEKLKKKNVEVDRKLIIGLMEIMKAVGVSGEAKTQIDTTVEAVKKLKKDYEYWAPGTRPKTEPKAKPQLDGRVRQHENFYTTWGPNDVLRK